MIKSLFVSLISVLALLAHAANAEPIAMITDLHGGNVALTSNSKTQKAEILTNLFNGDKLEIDNNVNLVLTYYESGREYSYQGPATVNIEMKQPKVLSGKSGSERELNLVKDSGLKPSRNTFNQAALVLRSGAAKKKKIKLKSPKDSMLLTSNVTFEWEPFAGTDQYQFTLIDDEGKTIVQTAVNTTIYPLPKSVFLSDDAWYEWQVEARLKTGETYSSMADFQVASSQVRNELMSLRPEENASISEKILYASLLEQKGFKTDAQFYWKAILKSRPAAKNIALKLK
jgi:hypothetical protein